MCQPWLLLLPLLSAHLLWALYKSLSQEECQLVWCQSEPRLPFHLSFLPVTEEGGKKRRGRRRRKRSYITNTHTHALVTLRRGSAAGAVGSLSLFPPPHSQHILLFSCCLVTFIFAAFVQLWGCIFKASLLLNSSKFSRPSVSSPGVFWLFF